MENNYVPSLFNNFIYNSRSGSGEKGGGSKLRFKDSIYFPI